MPDQSQFDANLFDTAIVQKRLRWEWRLRDRSGRVVMGGRERSRAEARYQSNRALFQLLLASCRRNMVKPA
jgi:hypothetical protein